LSVIESHEAYNSLGPLGRPSVDAGALGELPTLTRRQARLEERLGPSGSRIGSAGLLSTLTDLLGAGLTADRFEVQWRAAGLTRPGVIAQLNWPRLSTRVGLALEPILAHALVDRLLGFERMPAEGRLNVTPVEWGILGFVAARALDRLDEKPGPLGPWDLAIDRVGPDPFDLTGLGPIVTWKWRVKIGQTAAFARLWVPESLVALWLLEGPPAPSRPVPIEKFADLLSTWSAEAGSIRMEQGLSKLKKGWVLKLEGAPLKGTPETIEGPIRLVQDDHSTRSSFEARALPESQGARLILDSSMSREPKVREVLAMTTPADSLPPSDPHSNGKPKGVKPLDVPVTLVVELGRVNLPLQRLAELKPGDILELGRNPREPVELTSGGRLVARGELVQIDAELGVRVTQVFV
jgi:type III secretion system YscQ/HrcQ family protein